MNRKSKKLREAERFFRNAAGFELMRQGNLIFGAAVELLRRPEASAADRARAVDLLAYILWGFEDQKLMDFTAIMIAELNCDMESVRQIMRRSREGTPKPLNPGVPDSESAIQ